jgi:hypothetical protein
MVGKVMLVLVVVVVVVVMLVGDSAATQWRRVFEVADERSAVVESRCSLIPMVVALLLLLLLVLVVFLLVLALALVVVCITNVEVRAAEVQELPAVVVQAADVGVKVVAGAWMIPGAKIEAARPHACTANGATR